MGIESNEQKKDGFWTNIRLGIDWYAIHNDNNNFWLEFDDLAQLSRRPSMPNQYWAYFF